MLAELSSGANAACSWMSPEAKELLAREDMITYGTPPGESRKGWKTVYLKSCCGELYGKDIISVEKKEEEKQFH